MIKKIVESGELGERNHEQVFIGKYELETLTEIDFLRCIGDTLSGILEHKCKEKNESDNADRR